MKKSICFGAAKSRKIHIISTALRITVVGAVLLTSACSGIKILPDFYSGAKKVYSSDQYVNNGISKVELYKILDQPTQKQLGISVDRVRKQHTALFGNTGYIDLASDDEYDLLYYEAEREEHRSNLLQNITITHHRQCIYVFNSGDALILHRCRDSG